MRAPSGLVLALLLPLAACSGQPAAQAPVVRPALTVVVEPRTAAGLGFTGTVEPQVTTDLAFRVGGRLVSRTVDAGATVEKGQTVAAIDTTSLELAVRSAEADLTSAQSQLALASAEETRQRGLMQNNNVAQAAVDAAVQQRQSADAQVAQAQSALSKAQEQLGYGQLVVDYDAVVTSVGAQVGQVVSPGQTILTVAQPAARDAVVDVPDNLTGAIAVGSPFDVALQLDPTIKVTGSVREIAPQSDQATRTRRVKIGLVDPPETFWLGSTVTVTLSNIAGSRLDVPPSALLVDGQTTKVWVVDEGKVASRVVTIGPAAPDGLVPVLSGLAPGERIVVAGVHSLKDGQQVRIDGEPGP
jgi:RND family efflux transporter MFP subunit